MAEAEEESYKTVGDVITDIQQMLDAIAVPDSIYENVDPAKHGDKWHEFVVQALEGVIRRDGYSMYRGGEPRVSSNDAKRIVHRALICSEFMTTRTLRYYKRGIISEPRGFFVQRVNDKKRNYMRSPLPFVRMDKSFATWLQDDWIFEKARKKMAIRNLPNNWWAFYFSRTGRSFLMSFFLHTTSFVGWLLSRMTDGNDNKRGPSILRGISVGRTLSAGFGYRTPIEHLKWMYDVLWESIVDMVEATCSKVANAVVDASSEADTVVVRPEGRATRTVLTKGKLITDRQIFVFLTTNNRVSCSTMARFFAIISHVLVHFGKWTASEAYEANWEEDTNNAFKHVFLEFWEAIFVTSPSISATIRKRARERAESCFAGALKKFFQQRSTLRMDHTGQGSTNLSQRGGTAHANALPSGGSSGHATRVGAGHVTGANTQPLRSGRLASTITPVTSATTTVQPTEVIEPPPSNEEHEPDVMPQPISEGLPPVPRDVQALTPVDQTPQSSVEEADSLVQACRKAVVDAQRKLREAELRATDVRTIQKRERDLAGRRMAAVALRLTNMYAIDAVAEGQRRIERLASARAQVERTVLEIEARKALDEETAARDAEAVEQKKEKDKAAAERIRLDAERTAALRKQEEDEKEKTVRAKQELNNKQKQRENERVATMKAKMAVELQKLEKERTDALKRSKDMEQLHLRIARERESEDADRNARQVHGSIARIDGLTSNPTFSYPVMFYQWSYHQRFCEGRTDGVAEWMESSLEFDTSDGKQPTSHVLPGITPTKYENISQYTSTWNAILAVQCFVEIEKHAKNEATWRPEPQGDLSSLPTIWNVFSFARSRITWALELVARTPQQKDPSTARRSDIVACDMFVPEGRGSSRYACTFLGVVGNKVAKLRTDEGDFEELVLMILGRSENLIAEADTQVPNVCEIRRLGHIGSQLRSLADMQAIPTQSEAVHSLLVGDFKFETRNCFKGWINTVSNQLCASVVSYPGNFLRMVPDQRGMKDYVSLLLQDSPSVIGSLNSSQAAAVVRFLRMCFHPTVSDSPREQLRNNMLGVVGPAGTGKTSTMMHILSCLLNSDGLRESVLRGEKARQKWSSSSCRGHWSQRDAYNPFNHKRILIVATTNSALDVIEEKMQEGLPILHNVVPSQSDGTGHVTKAIPLYERYSGEGPARHKTKTALSERVRRGREKLIPSVRPTAPGLFGSVVLATFGSLHRAFPIDEDGRRSATVPWKPYDITFVEEAGQAADCDVVRLLMHQQELLRRNAHPVTAWFGDGRQLGPILLGPPTLLLQTGKVPLFERMVPEGSSGNGTNKIPSVLLDVQYRMHDAIGALSNAIAAREVLCGVERGRCERMAGCASDSKYVFRSGPMQSFAPSDYRSPVSIVYPHGTGGIENEPSEMDKRLFALPRLSGESDYREAAMVTRIVQGYVKLDGCAVEDILVVTPYSSQKELIERHLQSQNVQGVEVNTVTAAQGKEKPVVIYSGGKCRGNVGSHGIAADAIVSDVRNVYVAVTRAMDNLFLVCDPRELCRNSVAWRRAFSYLGIDPCTDDRFS